jgi:hypothetical protein
MQGGTLMRTVSNLETKATADQRRTERRSTTVAERRIEPVPVDFVPASDRRTGERRVKVERRRQIDPTTCERDYSDDEIEFMKAMDEYKRRSGRMFPTWSEVLEVVRDLGYTRPVKPR